MSVFHYHQGQLYIEGCSLTYLAEHYGTPSYVYSRAAISAAYSAYAGALGDHPGKICYAVKANSNLAVLQLLASLGAGFDIVSGGELERVLRAGGKAGNIIFSGVGKTRREMERALEVGIACFNVESIAELDLLALIAHERGQRAPVSLRVNPDVDAQTHPYISTGLKENKFGIAIEQAPEVYHKAQQYDSIELVGVDCHIGSQLTDTQPFLDALQRLLTLIDQLEADGIHLRHIDVGGGLGVVYKDEKLPDIAGFLSAIKTQIQGRGLALYMEPGRSIVANAGVLLTRVEYLKPTAHKNFAIIDAAMNDNLRPSLYQAWQEVRPLREAQPDEQKREWDLVGPVCETGDFLAKNRTLALQTGDYLGLMSSGAYGFVMSSNYNTRPRAPEILVDGDRHYLIRRRETVEELMSSEYLLVRHTLTRED